MSNQGKGGSIMKEQAILLLGKTVPDIEELTEVCARRYPTITESDLVHEMGEDFVEHTFFNDTHYYHVCLSDQHVYFKAKVTSSKPLRRPVLLAESY